MTPHISPTPHHHHHHSSPTSTRNRLVTMSSSKQKQNQQQRELKQKVLNCLHKLSDRDTYSSASSELETIAKTLTADTLSLYLSAISTTDPSDKSPLRKQCLRLIAILSQYHGNALAPHLSKLLSAVTRRLRDSDSSIRSACVSATGSIASHLTKPPFSLIAKPFLEAVFTEQEVNSQNCAAMCLAAAIDFAPDPDVTALRKVIPRLEKLVKSDGFKAKAAVLTLIGSVIGVGGAASQQTVRNLVPFLLEFVSSDDWASRKAAAEALGKLAVVEMNALSEFKSSYLKTLEAKRFDKVKAVRETMTQTLEAWNGIPDLSDELSPPTESQSFSKEITSASNTPQVKKSNKLSTANTTTKKRSSLDSTATTPSPAMFRKLDRKKLYEQKHDIPASHGLSETVVSVDDHKSRYESDLGKHEYDRFRNPEIKRALFHNSRNESFLDEKSESNDNGDHCKNHKESEDLSMIRKQLVQIENQQSNLLDLLQRFIGRSDKGMHSLESRVHGLELALDEISFDLALATGRMSNNNSGPTCCKLPGTDFFSSKLWKKTDNRLPGLTSTPPIAKAMKNVALINGDSEVSNLENTRYRFQSGREIIMNPLAGIPDSSPEVPSSRVSKNVRESL